MNITNSFQNQSYQDYTLHLDELIKKKINEPKNPLIGAELKRYGQIFKKNFLNKQKNIRYPITM